MKALVTASGPSLNLADIHAVHPRVDFCVAVSDTIEYATWATYHYSADYHWWHWKQALWRQHALTRRYTASEQAANEFGLELLEVRKLPGLSRERGVLHSGRNSGYQAINLAYLHGATTIYVLGLDCHGTHYFGRHMPELDRDRDYDVWIRNFRTIVPADYGIEIINLSPGSAVDAFPRKTIEEVFGRTAAA